MLERELASERTSYTSRCAAGGDGAQWITICRAPALRKKEEFAQCQVCRRMFGLADDS